MICFCILSYHSSVCSNNLCQRLKFKSFLFTAEIEDKFKKILKLVQDKDLQEKDGIKEPLVELIEGVHSQYQSLYAQYDNLRGELKKKIHGKKENETYSSSSSDSDSDSDHSSKYKSNKNGELESEYQKTTDGMKQELDAATLEVSELKRRMTATSEEKEALNLEYQSALSRIQEAGELIRNLKLEAERLNTEKLKLTVENAELNQKLDAAGKIEAELNREASDMKRQLTASSEGKEALNLEYQTALSKIQEAEEIIRNLKLEAESLNNDKLEGLAVNAELKQKLSIAGELEAELNHRLEAISRDKDNLIMEKETVLRRVEEGEKIAEDLRNTADQLNEEKLVLGKELETLKGKISNMEQQLESSKQEVSDLSQNLTATAEENKSFTLKISEMSNEFQQAQNLIQDLMAESSQLKEKMVEKEREVSSLVEMHEVRGNETLAQIKELQAQVTGLELELESLRAHNRDMVVQIDSKAAEAKQLEEENLRLQARISDLEMLTKERGDELTTTIMKLEANESESLSRIENLTAQINDLLADLDSLRNEKSKLEEHMVFKDGEASTQVKGLMNQVDTLQQELESLCGQKAVLEVQLEEKTREISEYIIEVQILKEEIVNKTEVQQKILEEIESLTARIKSLELEVASLGNQKSDLEEQMRLKIEEGFHLTEEKSGLLDRIFELEKTLTERGSELSSLQEKHINVENKASAQITAMAAQVDNLQQELDGLQAEKKQLESKLEKEREESSEGLIQLENQRNELLSKIAEQRKMLKEQEDAHTKLSEEYKQIEGLFLECKANLEVAERKIEVMTTELSKNIESKDQRLAELEEIIEDLKRDLEVKGDELSTLLDNVRQIEVKLRLSNQKLRVTEQLLAEKEEAFRKAEAKFFEEQRMLEQRIATLSGIIVANKDAYHKMITDITEKVNNTFSGLEIVIQRFEDAYENCEHAILETSKELQIAKNWVVEKNNEREQLKVEVSKLSEQLQNKKEQESSLRERVEELEVKASKEEAEKQKLSKAMHQLEKKVEVLETMMKEKDEGILGLEEEKREAIRQLCVWIEYHRNRYDYLKEVLSKMTLTGRRAT